MQLSCKKILLGKIDNYYSSVHFYYISRITAQLTLAIINRSIIIINQQSLIDTVRSCAKIREMENMGDRVCGN